jgi:cystathionine beta-lyase/cystathionine gamma-synthase
MGGGWENHPMTRFNTRAVRIKMPETAEEPLAPPIWQVADYAFSSAERYADVIGEREEGQVYGRYGSPTLEAVATTLADLENAESAWMFSSGMGALHAAILGLSRTGERILLGKTLYGGTYGLATSILPRYGIEVDFFDATAASKLPDPSGASLILVESVANPTSEVADLEGLSRASREHGIPLIVDNTVPTPYLLNPIDLGADLVIHSTSKYIGGHHDLMGGVVAGSAERIGSIRHLAINFGTTASAFECWLAMRGIASLGVRMEYQSASAMSLADALVKEKDIKVSYPGLPDHPQHDRASTLMRGYGAMLAVDVGSQERAWRFMDSLVVASIGSSFGGVRSQVSHPATTSHRQFSPSDRELAGIVDGLVRISVGLEDPQDLIEDFTSGLERS